MTESRLPHSGAVELPLDAVAPDPDQPRSPGSDKELAELVQSLRAHRLIQPIVVTPHPEVEVRLVTPYMILVGERRWRAARLAGLAAISAVIRSEEISASDRLLLQLAENDERAALSLLERARAYQRAHELSRLSQNAFAERCGKTKGLLSGLLRVANAEGLLRQALEEGLLKDLKAARLFEQLPAEVQESLLADARRKGQPITTWRLQAALDAAPAAASGRREPPFRAGGKAVAVARAAASPAPPDPPRPRPEPPRARVESIHIAFTYQMLYENLRFLGAKALPTLEAAADQLVRLLEAAMAPDLDRPASPARGRLLRSWAVERSAAPRKERATR